jgi:hypothetical protein
MILLLTRDDLIIWHHSGLWDIDIENSGLKRILYHPMAEAFLNAQQKSKNCSALIFS